MLRLGLIGLMLLPCAVVFAHPDDPKVRDRKPHFRGPGWSAARPDAGTRASFPAQGIELLSWMTLPELNGGATSGADCWGYTSPSGREYAIIGVSTGTAFVEITNPTTPVLVGHIAGPNSLWRDAQVYGTTAYAVSEGGSGIQVIGLSNIDNGTVNLIRTVTTGGGTTATHTVLVNEASGYLYRCGGDSNGLRIYNLAPDPTNPAFVVSWPDKYVHECLPVSYTTGPNAGKEIVFACNGFNGGFDNTGLEILDVTNKAAITSLSRVTWAQPGYSHQVWLSEDRQYAFINDELDESDFGVGTRIIVINIANLSAPFVAATATFPNSAIGHNFYVKGNLLYAANYTSGLRVYDITNPLAMTEKYHFDTWIEGDAPSFNGLWGNYPYFPSGTIIGSDLEKGLFVWQISPLDISYPDGLPSILNPRGDTLRVHIDEVAGTLDPASPALSYTIDGIDGGAPLVDLGGGDWEARFPASTCGGTVTFSVTASATNGSVVNDPTSGGYEVLSAFGTDIAVSENMEAGNTWTVGAAGDNATTGVWVRVNPIGTAAQPEDDHSAVGTLCWVTGNGTAGGGLGDADVDNGTTTLVTSAYNLTTVDDPRIGYWRWYSNNAGASPNSDTFLVQISNNNGTSWSNVETVGPSGPETSGGWYYHEFRVADIVTPTATVKLRFQASDLGSGSIVEAAIDDFQISSLVCETCLGDIDGDQGVGLSDLGIVLAEYATCFGPTCLGDLDDDDDVDLSDLGIILAEFGMSCE